MGDKSAGIPVSAPRLFGRLVASSSGWVYLTVPNAVGHGLIAALDEPGVELPIYKDEGGYNAHISVFTPDEVESLGGADKISERGRVFHYQLGPIMVVEPRMPGISRVWYVRVASRELEDLRKSYGLSPRPHNNEWDFHITIAQRQRSVLRNNAIRKTADWALFVDEVFKEANVARIMAASRPLLNAGSQVGRGLSQIGGDALRLGSGLGRGVTHVGRATISGAKNVTKPFTYAGDLGRSFVRNEASALKNDFNLLRSGIRNAPATLSGIKSQVKAQPSSLITVPTRAVGRLAGQVVRHPVNSLKYLARRQPTDRFNPVTDPIRMLWYPNIPYVGRGLGHAATIYAANAGINKLVNTYSAVQPATSGQSQSRMIAQQLGKGDPRMTIAIQDALKSYGPSQVMQSYMPSFLRSRPGDPFEVASRNAMDTINRGSVRHNIYMSTRPRSVDGLLPNRSMQARVTAEGIQAIPAALGSAVGDPKAPQVLSILSDQFRQAYGPGYERALQNAGGDHIGAMRSLMPANATGPVADVIRAMGTQSLLSRLGY